MLRNSLAALVISAFAVPAAARLRADAGNVVVSRRTRHASQAGLGHRVDRSALAVREAHFTLRARHASAARRGATQEKRWVP